MSVLIFICSPQEQEIIEHFSSCYVIGRSGTGKTTTMLIRMLGIERVWQKYRNGPKPRQVFITKSSVLATKVEEEFQTRMLSYKAAECSPKELQKMQKDVEKEIEYVDQDDNKRWRSDLPEGFSELLDVHFPLFITYDQVWIPPSLKHPILPSGEQLCKMLQKDIMQGDYNDGFIITGTHALGDEATSPTTPTSSQMPRLRTGSRSMSSSDYKRQSHRNFVSDIVFLTSYWDHLPQNLTRGLGEKQWRMRVLL
jgi:hypothetical protein